MHGVGGRIAPLLFHFELQPERVHGLRKGKVRVPPWPIRGDWPGVWGSEPSQRQGWTSRSVQQTWDSHQGSHAKGQQPVDGRWRWVGGGRGRLGEPFHLLRELHGISGGY